MTSQLCVITEWFDNYKNQVDASLRDSTKPWKKIFDMLEEKTGCDRVKIFFGAATFCALYLAFGYGAQLLCNIVGVLYPAFISIHSIDSGTKEDYTKWLTYWVTFGIFTVIEYFSDMLANNIPFYWLIKCAFLIWCMLPIEKNGSAVIYKEIVRPYYLKQRA